MNYKRWCITCQKMTERNDIGECIECKHKVISASDSCPVSFYNEAKEKEKK